MKIGIISDTHGHEGAWQTAFDKQFHDADMILHAGDVLYHGPRNPMKVDYNPAGLVEKINNSLKFNQGFMTTELCAASILDLKWHELADIPADINSTETATAFIDGFEEQLAKSIGLNPEITYRYRTTYFNHIFSSGYNTGYYGYLWSEVLDKDAFSIFEASPDGPFDLVLAKKFKETFLERGGSEEPMKLYVEFAGREPDSHAFLEGRGLI